MGEIRLTGWAVEHILGQIIQVSVVGYNIVPVK
jgi:hypothetical protein